MTRLLRLWMQGSTRTPVRTPGHQEIRVCPHWHVHVHVLFIPLSHETVGQITPAALGSRGVRMLPIGLISPRLLQVPVRQGSPSSRTPYGVHAGHLHDALPCSRTAVMRRSAANGQSPVDTRLRRRPSSLGSPSGSQLTPYKIFPMDGYSN